MINLILNFSVAFFVTFITTPLVIWGVNKYNLLDLPDHRKTHKAPVPTMGGIGIFLGLMTSVLLSSDFKQQCVTLLVSITIMTITGVIDDAKNLRASVKFIIQLMVALLLVKSGFVIPELFGVFGIHHIPLGLQYALSIIAITGIVNAFNLIDGIDCLAGGLGLISCVLFSVLFYRAGEMPFFYLSVSLLATLLAFLRYNFNPAKIFMGDTGSLLLGTMMAAFSLKYLTLISWQTSPENSTLQSPGLIVALIAIPVFDTLRVFAQRLLRGHSPFKADRIHIHHILIDGGLTHKQAVLLIFTLGLLMITNAWYSLLNIEYVLLLLFIVYVIALRIFSLLSWVKTIRTAAYNRQQINLLKSNNPFYKI